MALGSIPGAPGGPSPLKLRQPGTNLAGSVYAQRPSNPTSPYAVPTIPGGFGFTAPPPSLTRQQQFYWKQQGDEGLISQRNALNAQLGGYWGGTAVPTARAAYMAYGGNLGNLDLSRFGQPQDLSGNKIGVSIPEALAQIQGAATGNKFSQIAQSAQQRQEDLQSARANVAGRGLTYSSAMNERQTYADQAQQARDYQSGLDFLKAISGVYSDWGTTLGTAQTSYAQDLQDAADRVNEQIRNNMITAVPPVSNRAAPSRPNYSQLPGTFGYRNPFRMAAPATALPGTRGFQSGRNVRFG